MNIFILVIAAVVVGALIPIQSAAHAGTARYLGDVSYAVFLSFAIGLVLVSAYILIKKPAMAHGALSLDFPKYILLGGCISVIYTIAITYLSPRLGVGNTLFIIVLGQVSVSLLVDHFGIMGAVKQELTPARVLGVALILSGVYLTKKS